jgi:ComF family protein
VIRLRTVGADLLDVVFPRVCPACHAADDLDAGGFCPRCGKGLADNFAQDYCGRCGATVGPYGGGDGRCPACRGRSWPVDGTVRLGVHRGTLRGMLLAFKYANRDDLDRFFARRLGEMLANADWFPALEALVPVPSCWHRRLLGRGNVASALARQVARANGLHSLALLRRIRGGPSQIGLSQTERVKNVRGAFSPARGLRLDRAVLCLVDDVTTTGATLLECARILKRAGAAKVFAAVVCKQHGVGGP